MKKYEESEEVEETKKNKQKCEETSIFQQNLHHDVCSIIWSYLDFIRDYEIIVATILFIMVAMDYFANTFFTCLKGKEREFYRWTFLELEFDGEVLSEALERRFSSLEVKFKLKMCHTRFWSWNFSFFFFYLCICIHSSL